MARFIEVDNGYHLNVEHIAQICPSRNNPNGCTILMVNHQGGAGYSASVSVKEFIERIRRTAEV